MEPLPLLQSGIGRSKRLKNGGTRPSPFSEQLLVEERVGVATQLGEDLFEPKILALISLCGSTESHRLLSPALRLGIDETKARNLKSDEQLLIVYLRL